MSLSKTYVHVYIYVYIYMYMYTCLHLRTVGTWEKPVRSIYLEYIEKLVNGISDAEVRI